MSDKNDGYPTDLRPLTKETSTVMHRRIVESRRRSDENFWNLDVVSQAQLVDWNEQIEQRSKEMIEAPLNHQIVLPQTTVVASGEFDRSYLLAKMKDEGYGPAALANEFASIQGHEQGTSDFRKTSRGHLEQILGYLDDISPKNPPKNDSTGHYVMTWLMDKGHNPYGLTRRAFPKPQV